MLPPSSHHAATQTHRKPQNGHATATKQHANSIQTTKQFTQHILRATHDVRRMARRASRDAWR
eukprot:4556819-Lingulodinium_polyedra.AAC.1